MTNKEEGGSGRRRGWGSRIAKKSLLIKNPRNDTIRAALVSYHQCPTWHIFACWLPKQAFPVQFKYNFVVCICAFYHIPMTKIMQNKLLPSSPSHRRRHQFTFYWHFFFLVLFLSFAWVGCVSFPLKWYAIPVVFVSTPPLYGVYASNTLHTPPQIPYMIRSERRQMWRLTHFGPTPPPSSSLLSKTWYLSIWKVLKLQISELFYFRQLLHTPGLSFLLFPIPL